MFTRTRSEAPAFKALVEPLSVPGSEMLQFLAEQGLEPTPSNFALAYYRSTERRGLLAMAVDSILMEGRRLTQADAARIWAGHKPRVTDSVSEKSDEQQAALRHQTLQIAEIAAGAAAGSGEFGRALENSLEQLTAGGLPVEQLVAAMIQRAHAAEAQLAAASRKIDLLRHEVEAVRDDAMRDALTGLLNRRGITEELNSRAQRVAGTLALCDIDFFKSVNDRHGHAVGDRVLRGIAASLSESLGIHQVARWGGEEFLILIDGMLPHQAFRLLDSARRDVSARSFKRHDTGELIGKVTVSIGVTSLANVKPDAALEAADRLLYRAKSEGRDRIIM